MSKNRIYQLPAVINFSETENILPLCQDLTAKLVGHKIFYFPSIYFDILRCDRTIFNCTMAAIMRDGKGAQFACGTIATRGYDEAIPFLLTRPNMMAHKIRGYKKMTVQRKPAIISCTIVRMQPKTSYEENHKTLLYLSNAISEE